MSEREELKRQLDECWVALARRPKELRGGADVGLLPPRLWEELRQQLQVEYRRATGEVNAVLLVAEQDHP